jgi:hypothetical protein
LYEDFEREKRVKLDFDEDEYRRTLESELNERLQELDA